MEANRSEALELLAKPGWAWSLAHALSRDESEAEDALGEARLAALRGQVADAGSDSLRAWVARVVRNAVRRGRRGERRRAEREAQAARAESLPDAQRVLEREEARRTLVRALLAVPEPYRGTLIAHYYDGVRPSAIAARAGLPPSTVRNRLARGRALLRRELERNDAREARDWFAAVAPLLVRPDSMVPLLLGGLTVSTKSTLGIAGAAALALLGSLWWWNARAPQTQPGFERALAPIEVAETPAEARGPTRDGDVALAASPTGRVEVARGTEARGDDALVRVVDASGAPAPGAQVAWANASVMTEYWTAVRSDASTDLERLIAEAGPSAETDAAGELRIPTGGAALVVSARSGKLWGLVHMVRASTEPILLVLEAAHSLSFEVVDSHGSPAEGAPVGLVVVRADSAQQVAWEARTGVDGRVVLPHLEQSLRLSGIPNGLAYAALIGPLAVERIAIDVANPPEVPVRLVLPSSGSLRVRLTFPDGSPQPQGCWVSAYELRPDQKDGELERGQGHTKRATLVDGRAEVLWSHVGLGLDLEVEASPGGVLERTSSRVRGPTREGEEVLVELRPEIVSSLICGRLTMPDGTPARGSRVEMYLQGLELSERLTRAVADEDGRFQAPVERAFRGVPSTWRLAVSDGRGLDLVAATRTLVPPRQGVLDLGVVQLIEPDTFVAGQVIDALGAPVPHAQVSVARWTRMGGEGAPEMWSWDQGVESPNSDAEGRFRLLDDPPPGRFAIAARVGESGYGPFLPFERGARDVVLRLPELGGLAGRLLLPEGIDNAVLRVAIGPQSDPDSNNRPVLAPGPDGSFEFTKLEAGIHRALVRRAWDAEDAPLYVVDGVRVAAGSPSRDARLDPLDLREALHPLELEIVDPEGLPVPTGHVALAPHGIEAARSVRVRFENGLARLCGAGRSSDVEVEAPGFRSVRLEDVRGSTRMELERGFEVRVRVPASLALPTGDVELALSISPSNRKDVPSEAVLDPNGRQVGMWFGWPHIQAVFDEDRQADVLLPRDGTWMFSWVLVQRGDGSSRSLGVRADVANTTLVIPADGSALDVMLSPDLDDLARVLRELEK